MIASPAGNNRLPFSPPLGSTSNGTAVSTSSAVIKVVVNAMADSSIRVREAASAALKENARRHATIILKLCIDSLRTGKRRGGQPGSHHAGVLRVMAHVVREMKATDVEEMNMGSLVKIGMGEMINVKDSGVLVWLSVLDGTHQLELTTEWQQAASTLVVAVAARMPHLVMEEVSAQLSANIVPVAAIVRTLADFAAENALLFVPYLKDVLPKVLPVLGGVKDSQRPIFASAFTSWCEAVTQCKLNSPSVPLLDTDMQALIQSTFELFLSTWILSRESKVRLMTVEALGEMSSLIGQPQLKAALPKLIPAILNVYKKERDDPLPITEGLYMALEAAFADIATPLLDFQTSQVVLNAILPMANTSSENASSIDIGTCLRNKYAVLRCCELVGRVFPDDIINYLLQRIGAKDDPVKLGAFAALSHLIPRLQERWEGKKVAIVDAVKNVLHDSDFSLRKATVQVTVSMASARYFKKGSGEPFIEFLVRQCAIPDVELERYKEEEKTKPKDGVSKPFGLQKNDLRVGAVSPSELRAVCDKSLHLLSSTIPEMEPILWPFLLEMLLPEPYTGAVATVCKCISDLVKRKLARGEVIAHEFPKSQVLLARILVLLHNPMAREKLVPRLLGVLYLLAPLFHKTVAPLWTDEIPKMLSYISDKDESWQQALWDDMVLHFLSETLDVIHDQGYCMELGDAFGEQYDLYVEDHQHSALLHRCLGLVLGKIEDKFYVKDKIDLMYKRSDVSNETHRDGLAMGLGMVATTHLDTVLEKLRRILETHGGQRMRRLISFFLEQKKNLPNADDVCAAVALMYGYAAWYAPSSAIEARIETLMGSNMLVGLLGVKTAKPRQAIITAIGLLGNAVIKAARYGVAFQLRRRDEMLNHVMMFMGGTSIVQPYSQWDAMDMELLQTQRLALSACTTLVSVQPKLSNTMRDRLLQATMHFFTLPIEPYGVVAALLENLKMLLKALLRTGGDDGKSRSDLLLLLLQQIDQYVSSPVATQREVATGAVLELLRQFHTLCTAGSEASITESQVPEGLSPLSHLRFSKGLSAPNVVVVDKSQGASTSSSSSSSSAAPPLLPEREALKFGQRLMAYLPRCTDSSPLVRENTIQIIEVLFRIALLLPRPVGIIRRENKEAIYAAQSALQELSLSCSERLDALTTEEQQEMLKKIVSAVSKLITTEELVAFLRISERGVCDRTESAARGAIIAITDLVSYRGSEINDSELPRITDQLLTAAAALSDKTERQCVLLAVCELAEHSKAGVVFNVLLDPPSPTPGKKDGLSKKRDPALVEDAFRALAAHEVLGLQLLEHVIDKLNESPVYVEDDQEKLLAAQLPTNQRQLFPLPQAATVALGAIFRVGGDVRERVVEPSYARVLCALLLRMGSVRETIETNMQPVKDLIVTFRAFCDCLADDEMKEILSEGEQKLCDDSWIEMVTKIAASTVRWRPHVVDEICNLLWPALKRSHDYPRAAAAAVLSEYIKHNVGEKLVAQLVEALSAHIGDEAAVVRKLCVTGLAEIPSAEMPKYSSQVLSVVVARIDDSVEDVAYTAVRELGKVLDMVTEETAAPMLLNLCVRLRSLQNRENVGIRAAAFSAFGVLSKFFGVGPHREALLEQIHTTLPRLVFHVNDEAMDVRHACKTALRRLAPLLRSDEIGDLLNSRSFDSDRRLKYDDFLRDLTRHLAHQFADRTDMYMTASLQAFDGQWPIVQANAAYFAGCLQSHLSSKRPIALYLPQMTAALARMAVNTSSPVVREKSTAALSFLLRDME